MSGQADEYLAQLDRALERIEATNIDAELAADHAPHLLKRSEEPKYELGGAPAQTPRLRDSEKIDLAVSLLQSDVDVSVSPNFGLDSDSGLHEESGLNLALVQEAQTAANSFSGTSLSRMSGAGATEVSVSRSLEGPTLVHYKAPVEPSPTADEKGKDLVLESQELGWGVAANGAPISGQSLASASDVAPRPRLSASLVVPKRRGLFSANLGVNSLFALAVGTWLALGPAYLLTSNWLRERSHVAMAQLQQRVASPQSEGASSENLAKGLMQRADEAQGRFLWTWALMALAGSCVLAPPYRKGP